ncbi:MAG: calcium-translocating P-type ATPase, PMCA-type [Clostridia bacterium]|nr:calcium-translocating P-type ATPase, PMCA-type [Clostridia bacterium]
MENIKKDYFAISATESLKRLDVTKRGLNNHVASKRLKTCGINKIDSVKKKSKFLMFLSQFTDIMIIILLLAAGVSMTFAIIQKSSSELIDSLIILSIVLLNAILGFAQENKAEKAMEALKTMTHSETKVIRDGELKKVASTEVVVGDIIILEAGDIISADCRLIESMMLRCDEASLTGESEAVAKDSKLILSQNTILAEKKNMVFSGSVVANGRGLAVVTATGRNTEIGKIAKLLETTEKDDTPLQKGLRQIGKVITILVLFICAITFVIELAASPNSPMDAFLTAVAIAVAAIPESLPAVITIIMSLGIARLAKRKAIVKRLNAVETLGSCEIICSDKTGTITQNVMTVKALYYNNEIDFKALKNMAVDEYMLLNKAMSLCNDSRKSHGVYVGDPTETALTEYASKIGLDKVSLDSQFYRIGEIPFDSVRKLMTTVHSNDKNYFVFTKGALDEILKKCSFIQISGNEVELTESLKLKITQANKEMGNQALRVLGFAYKKIPEYTTDVTLESDLVFIGMAGMIDPPRKEAKTAVSKCKLAGIRPIMITGDHKHTAIAIAKEIGIIYNDKEVLTGAEIDKLNDAEFDKILDNVSVFARVSPENKVRIVDGFKRRGKIVAMTGDGVNDAPSLKRANIGVGMGITGTDVTKEVADLIITDDNFATIVIAVEEGRKIYTNIQKTVQFLFSANLAEITSIFVATLFLPQTIFLLPVQILFVNLISDTFPALALGLEPAEENIMQAKPRKSKTNLFSNGIGKMIVIMGLFQSMVVLACFLIGKFSYASDAIAMSMAFYSLNLVQVFYFLSIRAKGKAFKNHVFKNKWAVLSILFCVGIVLLIAMTPLHFYLRLVSLSLSQWLIILGLSVLIFFISELIKSIVHRQHPE